MLNSTVIPTYKDCPLREQYHNYDASARWTISHLDSAYQRHEETIKENKEELFSFINNLKKEFTGIELINMKGIDEISNNPRFFVDEQHLNYYGSIAFSSLLSERLSSQS